MSKRTRQDRQGLRGYRPPKNAVAWVELQHPVQVAGEEVTEVGVRRPTWKDMDATGFNLTLDLDGQLRATHALIPMLTRLDGAAEQLDLDDVEELSEVILGFSKHGKTSSDESGDGEESAYSPPT